MFTDMAFIPGDSEQPFSIRVDSDPFCAFDVGAGFSKQASQTATAAGRGKGLSFPFGLASLLRPTRAKAVEPKNTPQPRASDLTSATAGTSFHSMLASLTVQEIAVLKKLGSNLRIQKNIMYDMI